MACENMLYRDVAEVHRELPCSRSEVAMDDDQILLARFLFRARIDSLRNDVLRNVRRALCSQAARQSGRWQVVVRSRGGERNYRLYRLCRERGK